MNPNARRLAMTIVSLAAIATTGWSLYVVARHYSAPWYIAGAAAAVFDGIAYMCLAIASEAATEGRSAFGPRLTAVLMAAVSVYLNVKHSDMINGGLPAAVFFGVPTLGLLAVSEMSWAGPRAKVRAARGEQPYRLPAFGGWAWALAPARAGAAVRSRAVEHIQNGTAPEPTPAPSPDPTPAPALGRHSATEKLRSTFAGMDPAEAIRIAHEAQPALTPAELAALLVTYGVTVDAIQVALVLHRAPASVDVQRDDAHDAPRDAVDAHHDAPQVGALPPASKAQAIMEAASRLGPDARAADIAAHVQRINRITVGAGYVRAVLSRAKKDQQAPGPQGEGGYL